MSTGFLFPGQIGETDGKERLSVAVANTSSIKMAGGQQRHGEGTRKVEEIICILEPYIITQIIWIGPGFCDLIAIARATKYTWTVKAREKQHLRTGAWQDGLLCWRPPPLPCCYLLLERKRGDATRDRDRRTVPKEIAAGEIPMKSRNFFTPDKLNTGLISKISDEMLSKIDSQLLWGSRIQWQKDDDKGIVTVISVKVNWPSLKISTDVQIWREKRADPR